MHPKGLWSKRKPFVPGQVVIFCDPIEGKTTPAVILHQNHLEQDTLLVRTFSDAKNERQVKLCQLYHYSPSDALINDIPYRLAEHYIRTQGLASQRALLTPDCPTVIPARRRRSAPPPLKRTRTSQPKLNTQNLASIKLMLPLRPPAPNGTGSDGAGAGVGGSRSGSASTDVNVSDTPDTDADTAAAAGAGSGIARGGGCSASAGAGNGASSGEAMEPAILFPANSRLREVAEAAGFTEELQARLRLRLNQECDVHGIIALTAEVRTRVSEAKEKCGHLKVLLQQFESEDKRETDLESDAAEIAQLEAMNTRLVETIRNNTAFLADQKESLRKLPQGSLSSVNASTGKGASTSATGRRSAKDAMRR